jgi:hypothetical protein
MHAIMHESRSVEHDSIDSEELEHEADRANDPQSDEEEEPYGPARPAAAASVSSSADFVTRSDDSTTLESNTAASAALASSSGLSSQPTLRRVKLYSLSRSGVWEDKGPRQRRESQHATINHSIIR